MRASLRSSGDPATTAPSLVSRLQLGQPRTITLLWVSISSKRTIVAINRSTSRRTPARASLKRLILSHSIACSTNSMTTYSINGNFMQIRLTLASGKWDFSRKSLRSKKMKTRRWGLIHHHRIMVEIMTTRKSPLIHLQKGSLSNNFDKLLKLNQKIKLKGLLASCTHLIIWYRRRVQSGNHCLSMMNTSLAANKFLWRFLSLERLNEKPISRVFGT